MTPGDGSAAAAGGQPRLLCSSGGIHTQHRRERDPSFADIRTFSRASAQAVTTKKAEERTPSDDGACNYMPRYDRRQRGVAHPKRTSERQRREARQPTLQQAHYTSSQSEKLNFILLILPFKRQIIYASSLLIIALLQHTAHTRASWHRIRLLLSR